MPAIKHPRGPAPRSEIEKRAMRNICHRPWLARVQAISCRPARQPPASVPLLPPCQAILRRLASRRYRRPPPDISRRPDGNTSRAMRLSAVLLIIICVASASARKERSTHQRLVPKASVEEIAQYDSLAADSASVTISGFEKTLRSRWETFFCDKQKPPSRVIAHRRHRISRRKKAGSCTGGRDSPSHSPSQSRPERRARLRYQHGTYSRCATITFRLRRAPARKPPLFG